MIPWLDFKLFGGGRGFAMPFFDGRLYWLVDTKRGRRDGNRGQFYSWNGWLGAQLQSCQWFHPNAGEERILAGKRFRPFHSTRRGPRVIVSWVWKDIPRDLDEANAALRALENDLGKS